MAKEIIEQHRLILPLDMAGQRLDQALAKLLPHLSRMRLQGWIQKGLVTINAATVRSKDRVRGNEIVEVLGIIEEQTTYQPQPIELTIRYQDADVIILNKPSGLVVHPAAGNPDGTLQNALLHWFPELTHIPRSGIVHRLDKNTSGLLVVARSLRAHLSLIEQLRTHSMHREYTAVVNGLPVVGGSVDFPIGRHPTQRTRMAVTSQGKHALTYFQVQERFSAHSLLKVRLATGRTHQIRVHLEHIKYPILGDPMYSKKGQVPPGIEPELKDYILNFKRQALHAHCLRFTHPANNEKLEWEEPLPEDMRQLIERLRLELGTQRTTM